MSFHEQLLEMWPQCITHVQGIQNMSEISNVWKTLDSLSPFTEAKDRATDKTKGSDSTAEGNIKCYDTDIYCRIQTRRRGYPTCLAFPFLFFLRSKMQNPKIQDMFGTLWWQIQQTTKKPLNSVCMCVGVCFIRLLEELLFLETEWKKSWCARSFKAEEICKKNKVQKKALGEKEGRGRERRKGRNIEAQGGVGKRDGEGERKRNRQKKINLHRVYYVRQNAW